jgi:hypothetical protein
VRQFAVEIGRRVRDLLGYPVQRFHHPGDLLVDGLPEVILGGGEGSFLLPLQIAQALLAGQELLQQRHQLLADELFRCRRVSGWVRGWGAGASDGRGRWNGPGPHALSSCPTQSPWSPRRRTSGGPANTLTTSIRDIPDRAIAPTHSSFSPGFAGR